MPASPIRKKPVKVARPKSERAQSTKHMHFRKTGCDLSEPVALRIMKEMDVVPLDDTPPTEECAAESVVSKPKKLVPQIVNTTKKSRLDISGSPSLKEYRDDFILFRKSTCSRSKNQDVFTRLSDEVVLGIFKYLPKPVLVKCSEVCKRFKEISYDESLWRKYDFGKKLVKPGVLGILLRRGVNVLRLAMSEVKSPIFTDSEFTSANGYKYSSVQYLDLSMTTISENSLAELISVCKDLKKLSLENCSLNEDCCRYIAQNSELEVLNMAMCKGLSPTGLHEISVKCVRLKEWNLAWTNLTPNCMDAFLHTLPKSLLRFNISGHRQSFDDKALITVANNCPFLIELDISDSSLLTSTSFEIMIEKCSKLEHLHTSRSYNIPTVSYRALKGRKHFKKLEIFRSLTDEALTALRESFPDVKINQNIFSTIARPTTGIRRTSIWGLRVRD